MNLPQYGSHLGADYWSGGGCTDLGQPVYAVADGEVVEIVDSLGSYLDVVVVRHDVPDVGNVYSMYGHIARDDSLSEGEMVMRRQQIGVIDDVLAYFSPCHLHFELLNESAFTNGPFCNGCAAAGYSVSPGYDRQTGVQEQTHPTTGDRYLNVLNDGIDENWWFFTDEFIDARLDVECGVPDFEVASSSYPMRIHRDTNTAHVDLTIRNSGTMPWTSDAFSLATTEANELLIGDTDGYCDAPDDCRISLSADVQPGEEIDLAFELRLPEQVLEATQTEATRRFEWTMLRVAAGVFGPTDGADVQVCERADVESCDGVGPVVRADAGTTDIPDGGEPHTGGDAATGHSADPTPPAASGGAGNVVEAQGACCATLGRKPASGAPLYFFAWIALWGLARLRPRSGVQTHDDR